MTPTPDPTEQAAAQAVTDDEVLKALRASCLLVCSYATPGVPSSGCGETCQRTLADWDEEDIRHTKAMVAAVKPSAYTQGRAAGLREAAKQVPTSWLDPMLTGPNKVVREDGLSDVHRVLQAVKQRIERLEQAGTGGEGHGKTQG